MSIILLVPSTSFKMFLFIPWEFPILYFDHILSPLGYSPTSILPIFMISFLKKNQPNQTKPKHKSLILSLRSQAGGSLWFWGRIGLHSDFQVRWGYMMKLCFTKPTNQPTNEATNQSTNQPLNQPTSQIKKKLVKPHKVQFVFWPLRLWYDQTLLQTLKHLLEMEIYLGV